MSSPADALIAVRAHGRDVDVHLAGYLSPEHAEAAERTGNLWIKSLRLLLVDGQALRDRFRYRDESLWWFTEIYLHKFRTVAHAMAALDALETLIERERPARLVVRSGGHVARRVVAEVARQRGVACDERPPATTPLWQQRVSGLVSPSLRALGATVQRWRARRHAGRGTHADVALFIHRAFWKDDSGDDTYLGPLVHDLSRQLGPHGLHLVGVGPPTNFRARSWRRRWQEVTAAPGVGPLIPIEAFAPIAGSPESRALWRDRRAVAGALLGSHALRAASVVRGIDLWPLIQADLTRLATLQFPWAARAMDEVGAALDALRPRVVITYAEAGGWGRALALEARRRGIHVVGIQHGLISRHWLNYLHDADEVGPSTVNAGDRGFPFPDLTLLFDDFARTHLLTQGHFPSERLAVVGNQRMDALAAAAGRLTPEDLARVRADVGAAPHQHLVLLAAKRIPEFDDTFRALMIAADALPDVYLVVRPHPAETPEPYERLAHGLRHVKIVTTAVSQVALIGASRLVATVNSTIAIEAMALGVPALAMRLPNYLTPFVEEGAMAGTFTTTEIPMAVDRLVHDERARAALAEGRARFMARYGMRADGRATHRTVEAILELLQGDHPDHIGRVGRIEQS